MIYRKAAAMAKHDRYGYSVSDAEFAAWKNGRKGARPSASGGLAGSGCLVAMAAVLAVPVILIIGRKHHV